MDFRAICHGCAPPAPSVRDSKRQGFRRCNPRLSLSRTAEIPCNSRCMAGMTTNCCSPCLRAKQSSCRTLFEVWLSPQLEKSPEGASCWRWMKTAERANSYPAAGTPSGKSCKRSQDSSLSRNMNAGDDIPSQMIKKGKPHFVASSSPLVIIQHYNLQEYFRPFFI